MYLCVIIMLSFPFPIQLYKHVVCMTRLLGSKGLFYYETRSFEPTECRFGSRDGLSFPYTMTIHTLICVIWSYNNCFFFWEPPSCFHTLNMSQCYLMRMCSCVCAGICVCRRLLKSNQARACGSDPNCTQWVAATSQVLILTRTVWGRQWRTGLPRHLLLHIYYGI